MPHEPTLFHTHAASKPAARPMIRAPAAEPPQPSTAFPAAAAPSCPGREASAATDAGAPIPFDKDAKLLLTEREAAKVLSVSPRTLWGLRAAGEIPCIRLGRAVRYDPADLAAWISSQKA